MKTPEEKREYGRRYREVNREKLLIDQHIRNMDNRESRLQWNKDHEEHRKQYARDHREKIREDQKKWREKHKDYHAKYYIEHLEKIKEYRKLYKMKHQEEQAKIYKSVVKITLLTEEPLDDSPFYTLETIARDCMEHRGANKVEWLMDSKLFVGKHAENALKTAGF